MILTTLLRLQLLYLAMGISYNIVSQIFIVTKGQALSGNSPLLGAAVMIIYGLFLIPGFFEKHEIYRILMFLAFILLGYSGILRHLLSYNNLSLYYSGAAWLTAILINAYGAILNIVAFTGKYK